VAFANRSLQDHPDAMRSDPTAGRYVDLHWAEVWLQGGRGVGLEDVEIGNDRPSAKWRWTCWLNLDWDRSTSSG
jgi:hypothetical protein